MTDYESSQLEKVRAALRETFDPEISNLSLDELVMAEKAMAEGLARFDGWNGGAVDRATVADALITMADMLSAPVPGEKGIDLFMLSVEDVPAVVWPLAHRWVARTHRFMRMPLPSDYLNAAKPYIERLQASRLVISNPLDRTRSAIQRRKARQQRYAN